MGPFKQLRALYITLLLHQLEDGMLDKPFVNMPQPGPLPKLPAEVSTALLNRVQRGEGRLSSPGRRVTNKGFTCGDYGGPGAPFTSPLHIELACSCLECSYSLLALAQRCLELHLISR